MMVKLDLSNFFTHHKSFARIFLRDGLRCIGDVAEHIQNTFNIEVDYLYCGDNEYLPPSEDARIIKEGDVIRVMRKYKFSKNAEEAQLAVCNDRLVEIRKVSGNKQEEVTTQTYLMGNNNEGRGIVVKRAQTDEPDDNPKTKWQKRETKIAEPKIRLNTPYQENITEVKENEKVPFKIVRVKKVVDSKIGLSTPYEENIAEVKENGKVPPKIIRIRKVKENTDSENGETDSESDPDEEKQQQSTVKNGEMKKKQKLWEPERSTKPSEVSFRKHIQIPAEPKIGFNTPYGENITEVKENEKNLLKVISIRRVKEKTDSEDGEADSDSDDSDEEKQQQSTVKKNEMKKKQKLWEPVPPEHSTKPSQVSFRKHIQIPNEEPTRRVNIIETIILRNGKSEEKQKTCQKQESEPAQLGTSKSLEPVNPKKNISNISNGSGIGNVEECAESMDQSLNSDSTVGENKPKRKRIRKRKRPTPQLNTNANSGLASGNFIAKDVLGRDNFVVPKLHLKFDDDKMENDTRNEHSIETGQINQEIRSREHNYNKQRNGNSQAKEDAKIDAVRGQHNLTQVETVETSQDVISEEANVPQAPTTDRNLIVGDKLSFKILRLTENYCPELSSLITGTVLDFQNETGMVNLNIEDGLDQCNQPLGGKFSIEIPDEVPEEASNKTRVFSWSELLEPRIL